MKILKFTAIIAMTFSLQAADLVLSSPKGSSVHKPSKVVLEEAYKKIGVGVSFVEMPGERSLKDSNSGKNDGEVTRIKGISKKYKNLVIVPVAINYLEGSVLTKNKKFDVKGWDSLKPYKVGIVRGVKFVEKGTKGMNVQVVGSFKQAFQLLDKGRIDVIVAPKLALIGNMKKFGTEGMTVLEPAIVKLDLYHHLHKKNVNLVDKLKAELQKMKDSGRIEEIRKKLTSK